MLGYCQRKVIIDSLLDFASYAFYYINIEVTYELLTLEIIADNPSVDFGMPGELFEVKQATLSEHINNIISSGELDETSIGFSDKSSGGRKPKIYNLDMLLSVGYRVNSKRGIAFRRWANSVLKKYVIQGYAINEKRLQALERTVDIQTKMLAGTLEVEESDILKAVTSYTDALMLLDQYDHQSLKKPVENRPIYKITYEECKKMVSHMEDSFKSDVFGVEKENGKVEGILAAVYQSVFGGDVYPSLEEKAANLLYFMIKDHPYADGCKRIAASLFWNSLLGIMLYIEMIIR